MLLTSIRCIDKRVISSIGKCNGRSVFFGIFSIKHQIIKKFSFVSLSQKLFANRDYVFNRRFFVDRNRKLIIIVNKSIVHPFSPKRPNIQRVNDYWSCMVIRSTSNSLKTPGLEYVLTYFENPGVVLPQSVTSWVAQKQLPDFLHKLYTATLDYAREKRQQQEQQQKHHNQRLVCVILHFATRFLLISIFIFSIVILIHNLYLYSMIQYESVDYFLLQDPGYEYPPDPEIFFSKYKRNGNDDDVENGDDDDDDFDDIKSDNKNSNKMNGRTGEKGAKFNMSKGEF